MPTTIITAPSILTDDIFVAYGGQTGTSTAAQRQAAYAIAEGQAVDHIGTFLAPTTVTGTYTWPPTTNIIQIEYSHLRNVAGVTLYHEYGCNCKDDAVTFDGCAWIKSADAGVIELRDCNLTGGGNCSCGWRGWYGRGSYGAIGTSAVRQVQVAYEAGLPTGAAFDPRMRLGLTMAANIALEQIIDPNCAEGGPGDPGVQEFSSLTYSEKRTPLKATPFGSSPRANYAANQLEAFKIKKAMKVGF